MEILPSTAKEALLVNFRFYYTGVPCKHGHICNRYAKNHACFTCQNKSAMSWKMRNLDTQAERNRRDRVSRSESIKIYRAKRWMESREKCQEQSRKWRLNNLHKSAEATARRQKAQKVACPPWVKISEIQAIYKACRHVSATTGIAHQVDHIVPLRNATVCGLHVPWNLRIITRDENYAKRNRLEGEGLKLALQAALDETPA